MVLFNVFITSSQVTFLKIIFKNSNLTCNITVLHYYASDAVGGAGEHQLL